MAEKVIVLHGWGKGIGPWQKFKKELEKADFTVFLPELPGFGQTPAPEKPWSVSDYVIWLKSQLPERYWLAGHSFGGRLAIKLASTQPVGLQGLILIDSAGIKPRSSIKKFSCLILAKTGRAVCLLPPFCLIRGLARKALYRLVNSRDYYQAQGVMKKTLRQVVAEDLKPLLKKIKIPTLILWGESDHVTPLKDARLINQLIKGSQLKIFPGRGHLLPFQQTQPVIEAIGEFIKKHS